MPLANGAYPLNITITRADGVTNSYNGNIVIGDDVIGVLGVINHTTYVNQLAQDQVVEIGLISSAVTVNDLSYQIQGSDVVGTIGVINKNVTVNSVSSLVGSGVTAQIGLINKTVTINPISASIEAGPVVEQIGLITKSVTLLSLTADDGLPVIIDSTAVRLGEPFTVTVGKIDLLNASSVTMTLNGIDLGAPIAITSNTITFITPLSGLIPNATYDLVLHATG